MLTINLGTKHNLRQAQTLVKKYHYLHTPVHNIARPMVYTITINHKTEIMGLIIVSNPQATRLRGWWGYPGLITKWQVVNLSRIWLNPAIQKGGQLCKPGLVPGFIDRKGIFQPITPSWAIGQVLKRVQKDRIAMHPPVYPAQPYHIRLVISYHDPKHHSGHIYRAANAEPVHKNKQENIAGLGNCLSHNGHGKIYRC